MTYAVPTDTRRALGAARPENGHPGRDRGIDLVRACCLIAVVALHSLMVGVSLTAAGPVFENAAEGHTWFVPVSWVMQVMPLFFIVGGFSSMRAFTAARRRGIGSAAFVAGRMRRMLAPALAAVATVGAGLLALTLAGVGPDVVAVAGFRISQPLWFLAVYLGCQALVPALIAAHEKAPRLSVGVLAAAVVLVDALARLTSIEAIGFLNLAFVWLLIQQWGFWLADGRFDRMRPARLAGTALVVLSGLAVAIGLGVYSPDMYVNLNPPTAALAVLGVVQLMVLVLLRDRLRRWSAGPVCAAVCSWITTRSMTVYLWHMPVLIALAGLSLLGAVHGVLDLPAPGTPVWWVSRPLWFAAAFACVALVSRAAARWERRRAPQLTTSGARAAVSAALGIGATLVLLIGGVTVGTAAVSILLMMFALLATDAGSSASPPPPGTRIRTMAAA